MRLGWVQHFEKTVNASLTSRRALARPCEVVSRYQGECLEGLLERSNRPKRWDKEKATPVAFSSGASASPL